MTEFELKYKNARAISRNLEHTISKLQDENARLRGALEQIASFDLHAQANRTEHLTAWCSMTALANKALARPDDKQKDET